MDEKRDPLLGIRMKDYDMDSDLEDEVVEEEEEEEQQEQLEGEAEEEEFLDEEQGSGGDLQSIDGEDRLFPSDGTEDYTNIPSLPTTKPISTIESPIALTGHRHEILYKNNLDTENDLLPGETLQLRIPDALFLPDELSGTLLVTSYRFQFTLNQPKSTWRLNSYFKIPVTTISKIVKKQMYPSDELTIVCRDGRQNLRFKFSSEQNAKRAHSLLLTLAFPVSKGGGFRWFFCFSRGTPKPNPKTLLDLLSSTCSFLPEDDTRFRESVANWDYSLCSSYPKSFFVPKNIPDQQIKQVACFRSKGRVPALCWYDKRILNKGGSIWRCSQPKVGFGASFSLEDEALIESIRKGTASNTVLIIDCRSAIAAMANKARGLGSEDASRYRGTRVQFENIANFHSVRTSYLNLCRLLNKSGTAESIVFENFQTEVENTGWLTHLRTILTAAIKTAEAAGCQGVGVIVHCSDGWDRTSQVVSLAEMLVDPEYRTLKGFIRLIHREWVLFGHKFRDRTGVGIEEDESEERSPIFVQFLDCVWQLKRLFPKWFEFNELLIQCLAHHFYSSRFIEFVGNTAEEWEKSLQHESGGSSLWELLLCDERSESTFCDPNFVQCTAMLIPRIPVICRQLVLWDVFLKGCGVPSHTEHALDISRDDANWEWWM